MDYALIKAAVAAVIKENGNEEITGNILQQVLLAVIDVLGLGYQYMGIATPSTNPGTPDAKVFYIAQAQGTYSNFNDGSSSPVLDGTAIGIFAFDTQWHNTILDVATKSSLADYLKIADLAAGIGDSETTAMTQKAVTELLDGVATELGKKANKVVEGTSGNLPKLTANGDLADSDIPATDVATKQELAVATLPGLAEAVIDTDGAGTEQQFAFRKSGGDGGANYRKIKGKTLAWNQLASEVLSSNIGQEINGITTTYDLATKKFHIQGTAAGDYDNSVIHQNPVINGHKYLLLVSGLPKGSIENNVRAYLYTTGFTAYNGEVVNSEVTANTTCYVFVKSGETINKDFYINLVDLTQMFGAGNEPATAADFEKLFYLPYYAPNAGTLIHNATTKIKTRGFNQWDEQWESGISTYTIGAPYEKYANANYIRNKNLIKVSPNTSYYVACENPNIAIFEVNNAGIVTQGRSRLSPFTTLDDTAYLTFYVEATTYNHDICINLSDPAKNSTYEPYWEREINLDLTTKKASDDTIPFPNGAMGAGTAQDWADEKGGEIVMDKVDLGSLNYIPATRPSGTLMYSDGLDSLVKKPASDNVAANAVCSQFVTYSNIYSESNGIGLSINVNGTLFIFTPETDPAAFKAAMQGVELVFERATRVPFTWKEPLKLGIKVDEDGTEQALPEQTATPTSAPFEAMTTYTMSIARMVQKLASI